jgi:hypothetical protein
VLEILAKAVRQEKENSFLYKAAKLQYFVTTTTKNGLRQISL